MKYSVRKVNKTIKIYYFLTTLLYLSIGKLQQMCNVLTNALKILLIVKPKALFYHIKYCIDTNLDLLQIIQDQGAFI